MRGLSALAQFGPVRELCPRRQKLSRRTQSDTKQGGGKERNSALVKSESAPRYAFSRQASGHSTRSSIKSLGTQSAFLRTWATACVIARGRRRRRGCVESARACTARPERRGPPPPGGSRGSTRPRSRGWRAAAGAGAVAGAGAGKRAMPTPTRCAAGAATAAAVASWAALLPGRCARRRGKVPAPLIAAGSRARPG